MRDDRDLYANDEIDALRRESQLLGRDVIGARRDIQRAQLHFMERNFTRSIPEAENNLRSHIDTTCSKLSKEVNGVVEHVWAEHADVEALNHEKRVRPILG